MIVPVDLRLVMVTCIFPLLSHESSNCPFEWTFGRIFKQIIRYKGIINYKGIARNVQNITNMTACTILFKKVKHLRSY